MTAVADETVAGWGGLVVPGRERRSSDLVALTRDAPLSRGLGRSYGDAALPADDDREVAGTRYADLLLAFDDVSGRLRAEAGVSLATLNRLFLPRGWFTPVSPGTEHVTLGGMVAADVHGKNHHLVGSIGRHVRSLTVRLASGDIVSCGPDREPELFWGTIGGMGLTGHLLEVEVQLERVPTARLEWRSWRLDSLTAVAGTLRSASREWPYTAAWVDGLGDARRRGRGIVLAGRWVDGGADDGELGSGRRPGLEIPITAPDWLLNRFSVGLFNALYYRRHARREREGVGPPWRFFYPLDAVGHWNRLYGERGFVQHQCVVPPELGVDGVAACLDRLRAEGGEPYLIVLKDFGAAGRGLLSFPRPGFTLAVDLPMTPATQRVIDRVNRYLIEVGGGIYLAKDALTRREDFEAMEGERVERFRALRRRLDPERRIRSRLSERLGL